jgi:hypothetical protein
MSATICSSRLRLDSSVCIVPQRALSCTLARSVSAAVWASNQSSILRCEVMRWSMSRAS